MDSDSGLGRVREGNDSNLFGQSERIRSGSGLGLNTEIVGNASNAVTVVDGQETNNQPTNQTKHNMTQIVLVVWRW